MSTDRSMNAERDFYFTLGYLAALATVALTVWIWLEATGGI